MPLVESASAGPPASPWEDYPVAFVEYPLDDELLASRKRVASALIRWLLASSAVLSRAEDR